MSDGNNCVYEQPNHFQALNVFRERNTLCDVTIKVGRQEMRAHRVILASTTNYFETMFTADYKERNNDVISIENVNEKSMQAIIEFSYTGKIVFTKENATNLLKDADFFELKNVKDKCAEYLESSIDVNNVCEVANLAKLLPECNSLLERTSTFIRKNLRYVSLTDAFTDLDFEIFKAVLSEGTSEISAELIFDAIINWALGDVEREKNDMLQLFRYVNPFKLTAQSLAKYLIKDQVKNGLNPKRSEFIKEALLLFSEPRAVKKSYIYVINDQDYKKFSIYDFTNEKWNNTQTDPHIIKNIAWARGAVTYNGKLYAFSKIKISIMYICDFYGMIQTSTEVEIPFDSSDSLLALLDDCLYVCGVDSDKIVWRFSLKTQSWQSVCQMKSKPHWHQLLVLQGDLYAVGTDVDADQETIEKYCSLTDNWMHTCNVNSPRWSETVGLNGKIYVCGGWNDNNEAVALVAAYDIKEKRWTYVASMNTARSNHAAVVHEGKIWVIGGTDKNKKALSSVEVYDPSTDSWSYGKPMTNSMEWPYAFIFLSSHLN